MSKKKTEAVEIETHVVGETPTEETSVESPVEAPAEEVALEGDNNVVSNEDIVDMNADLVFTDLEIKQELEDAGETVTADEIIFASSLLGDDFELSVSQDTTAEEYEAKKDSLKEKIIESLGMVRVFDPVTQTKKIIDTAEFPNYKKEFYHVSGVPFSDN